MDAGAEIFHLDLAVATGDREGYLAAMITLPEDHERHAAWYDTVFTHVVYALSPPDG